MVEVGDVFRGLSFVLSGQQPHYYLVVHKTQQNELVVVYFTRSLARALKACRRDELDLSPMEEPQTYVEVGVDDCPALRELSAINCNRVEINPESFYTNDPIFEKCEGKAAPHIIEKVKRGIKRSSTVPKKIIDLL